MYSDPTSIDLTNPINLIYYIDNNSNQLFGMGIIVAIGVLVFLGYFKIREDFIGAFATACFVSWVLGLLAWIGNLIPAYFFSIITGITIISALLLFMERGNS